MLVSIKKVNKQEECKIIIHFINRLLSLIKESLKRKMNKYYICLLVLFVSTSLFAQKDSILTTYYYDSGKKSSEGYLVNGQPNGYWKTYYENGNIKSEGNRKKNLLSGVWKFYTEGEVLSLEITYKEGKKDGEKRNYKDSVIISIELFKEDKKEGITAFYYSDGKLRKEVPFEDDKESGIGFEYAYEGTIQTLLTYKSGVLVKQQKINRKDKIGRKQGLFMTFYENRKTKSEGTYKDDLKHGYFKYYDRKGSLLRTERYINGILQEDMGTAAKLDIRRTLHKTSSALKTEGTYRNGVPDGVHREFNEEGKVVGSKVYSMGKLLSEGIYDKQGRRQGPWKFYYPSGELKEEGSYKNDEKVGTWNFYYTGGKLEQTGTYIRDLEEGPWTWYYENGAPWREEEYFQGKEEGQFIEYNDTGKVISKGEYVDGYREGEWFYEVGDHREIGSYLEGEKNGLWKHYYTSNEQLRFEGSYQNGSKNGDHRYYYDTGIDWKYEKYSSGMKEGVWVFYRKNGDVSLTIEYKNGEEIKYNGVKVDNGKRKR